LGPEAAANLIPDEVLDAYAITGSRPHVVSRLRQLRAQVRPELLVFDAQDYSIPFLESVAAVAMDAGAVVFHNQKAVPHGLDSHD
jgi:hypothetical protein